MAKRCPPGCKPAKKRASKKTASKGKRRGNCAKYGRSPTTGKCRKGPPVGKGRSRGGVDDSVRAAMRKANSAGQYPRMLRLPG